MKRSGTRRKVKRSQLRQCRAQNRFSEKLDLFHKLRNANRDLLAKGKLLEKAEPKQPLRATAQPFAVFWRRRVVKRGRHRVATPIYNVAQNAHAVA